MDRFDVAIIGAGIVGLATGERLAQRHPDLSVVIIERRGGVGLAQSGRNSGVIHSGIYYTPGSIKARTCRRGREMLVAFCAESGIPVHTCGKLIVAADAREERRLEMLAGRAEANGVRAVAMTGEGAREIEPHVNAHRALHVPDTGVVDFGSVCGVMARRLEARGGRIMLKTESLRARERSSHVVIETDRGEIGASQLVACAGMGSVGFARASGLEPEVRILPFKGGYCTLRDGAAHLCRTLIYPVPDPRFPFLGAHFTRRIDGCVEVGPTAVPALSRGEGRSRVGEGWDILTEGALRRLALRYAPTGGAEFVRTVSRGALARALRRLVPEVKAGDLIPAPAGLRAQALRRNGTLLDDFLLLETARMIHLCNAPSPAATASLAIADQIVDRLEHHS